MNWLRMTCVNALEGEIWKNNHVVVTDEKINPKILMDEELLQNGLMGEKMVQNGVMDGKFVKNFVMCAKLDPKVVMDLLLKIGGWNSLQPINRNLLEEFIDEKEP